MTTALLTRLREHPDAPRWNHQVSDRLGPDDLVALDDFRQALSTQRRARDDARPPPAVIAQLAALIEKTPLFRARVGRVHDLAARWAELPTTSREELATVPEQLVPDGADLARMVCYRTSGTSGHLLIVPYDPRTAALNVPLIELALARHGVPPLDLGPDDAACFLVGAQLRTVTYAATLSAWRGAGFAKLNLRLTEWPTPASPQRYLDAFGPRLLTGDPISFAEMLRLEIAARPAALLTTAVAMSANLRRRLAAAYAAPVIDWYSLTETGPLGYACPRGDGSYHQLPHDVHLEVVGPDGRPLPDGERGEITVSGGRNPFIPLLRYRTGDHGRIDRAPCPCGDPMPRLVELEGRAPVLFRALDGRVVNPIDVSRLFRELPLVQHELVQTQDGALELTARPVPGVTLDEEPLRAGLAALFGDGVALRVTIDPALGDKRDGGKVIPFRSEYLLDE